jgi:dihydroxy-acid dehydratase
MTEKELTKPIIGIANSANDIIPGHMHLNQMCEAIKAGIYQAGGMPLVFSTIGICDGIAMDHHGMKFSLPSRELICDSIEIVANGMPFDGLVFLTNCDKITPGMMMAMGKLNIPSIIVSGGPMLAGSVKGKSIDLVSVFEAVGHFKGGRISEEELVEIENYACPGAGSCAGLFTANSMNALSEALGIALKGNGTIPAVFSERIRLAKEAGNTVVKLVENNMRPRDIVKENSFYNAVAVDLALGGSTNTTLHLTAIARCFEIDFQIDIFDRMSRQIPHICNLSPVGDHHIQDLHSAGGIFSVMNRLMESELIRGEAQTVYQDSIQNLIKDSEVKNHEVIRPLNTPYHPEGGLAILYGNLAPQGAVTKMAGIPEKMKHHTGPAVVFEDGEKATVDILAGKIKKGDVIVIRYEGPKGGPGMREMLSPTSAIVGLGLMEEVALITDGRFSGGSKGCVIGHISPEAAEKGPIAVIQNGDTIEINLEKRELNLLVTEDEFRQRCEKIKPHDPNISEGCLQRYALFVQSAHTGATFKDV